MNKPTYSPAFGAGGPWGQPSAQQILARLQQACALHQQGRLAEAAPLYEAVLKAQPRNFDALHLLGVVALQTHDYVRAVDLITKALKVDRGHVGAHNHRGAAYVGLKQYDLAAINYNKAIELAPGDAEGWNNRGTLHLATGRLEAALADFDQALSLDPAHVSTLNNRGNALSELGRHAEAIASYQRAVELNPSLPDLRWSLGMACLRNGEFARGWAHSEARLHDWMALSGRGRHAQPRWTGSEPLEGRTLLLQCEQGLGDTIQFSRYASVLAGMGARVVLEAQPPLLPLLEPFMPLQADVVALGEPLPAFDLHCPLLSVPMALRTDLSSIPAPTPIRADPSKLAPWRAILGDKRRPRVGIVWSGNADHVDDGKRSMAFADLLPLLDALGEGIDWISLHKEVRPSDEAALAAQFAAGRVRHFGDRQQDFTDAAAMCELLDLVITVDTSLAHLAGSMGRPTWVLLARNADWRWLTDRADSPWYPSATLYRQQRNGDWAELLGRVAADLRGRFPG